MCEREVDTASESCITAVIPEHARRPPGDLNCRSSCVVLGKTASTVVFRFSHKCRRGKLNRMVVTNRRGREAGGNFLEVDHSPF